MKTPMLLILVLSTLTVFAGPPGPPKPHKPRSIVPSTNHVYRVNCPDCGTTTTNHPSAVWCSGGRAMPNGEVLREFSLMFNCPCGSAFVARHEVQTRSAQASLVAMDVAVTNKSKVLEAPKAKP